jgi:hypothetical protein
MISLLHSFRFHCHFCLNDLTADVDYPRIYIDEGFVSNLVDNSQDNIQYFKRMQSVHDLVSDNRSNLVNGIGTNVMFLIQIMENISFHDKDECLSLLHNLKVEQSTENIDSFLDDLLA